MNYLRQRTPCILLFYTYVSPHFWPVHTCPSKRTLASALSSICGCTHILHSHPALSHTLTLVIDAPVLVQVGDDQELLQLLLVQGLANHFHGGLQLVARYEPIAITIEYSAGRIERKD